MLDLLGNQLTRLRRQQEEKNEKGTIITETIFQYAGVKLAPMDFVWLGRNLYLKTSPLKKNQIFLKQKIILRQLEEILGRGAPRKIL